MDFYTYIYLRTVLVKVLIYINIYNLHNKF